MKDWFMITSGAIVAGLVLDLIFGDPRAIPHPVVLMGKTISYLEDKLRRIFSKDEKGELAAGAVMAVIMVLSTFLVTAFLSYLAFRIDNRLFFFLQTIMCWQTVAIKDLAKESREVYKYLGPSGNLARARKQVSRIVGRDTAELTEEGVTKAVVETIAENFSDGVVAPVFYMMIGAGPLAMTYKAINTMDSMVGYKNDRYLYFGRTGAHMDDAAGFIPSRLAALFWIAATYFTGHDWKNAWKIWRRDRFNHASPNSAQTESACAGSLGLELLGPAYYFGEYHDKPTVGDPLRKIEPDDILKAIILLYTASIICYAAGLGIRTIFYIPALIG